jgi:hypothetical protein
MHAGHFGYGPPGSSSLAAAERPSGRTAQRETFGAGAGGVAHGLSGGDAMDSVESMDSVEGGVMSLVELFVAGEGLATERVGDR